jgi:hypothetical protein
LILAHAFGARYDLPIPLILFVLGGGLVVLLSFVLVLGRLTPHDDVVAADADRPIDAGHLGGVVAVIVTAALVYAGLAGNQEVAENILPTAFWLIVWVAVPVACGLVGDFTRSVNPFAALARLTDRPGLRRAVVARDSPLPWPRRVGWWPAVVLFFLLACAELIFNRTATLPRVIATGLLVYAVVNLAAGLLLGAAWLQRGEVFSVLFSTWGRLGWFRFRTAGPRGFTGGLRTPFEPTSSRIAFVLLLLISVNFDGLLTTPRWAVFEREHVGASDLEAFRIASFLALAAVIAIVFGAFAALSARAGRHDVGRLAALAGLLPSMVPIAFAYLVAHNLQYLLVNAQLLGPLIGNPTGTHDFGLPYPFNDSVDPNPTFLPNAFYWYVGVVVIVGAHVLAVVLAHRHLRHRPTDPRLAQRSEYPWLVAMVGYTMVSLTLIAQPLVTEKAKADALQPLKSAGSASPRTVSATLTTIGRATASAASSMIAVAWIAPSAQLTLMRSASTASDPSSASCSARTRTSARFPTSGCFCAAASWVRKRSTAWCASTMST